MDGNIDVGIYTFELVIRLSRVKQLAIFPGLTRRCRCVEVLAAVLNLTLFLFSFVDVNVLNNWPQYWASTFFTDHFA